jgi:hypothetical protein
MPVSSVGVTVSSLESASDASVGVLGSNAVTADATYSAAHTAWCGHRLFTPNGRGSIGIARFSPEFPDS